MSIDIATETSLEIAEKLLEQEHILNIRRIEVLTRMMLKLAKNNSKFKELLAPELKDLIELEKGIQELKSTSLSVLSPPD